jgi:putative tryptophan/tyrosine transport system substrate-binding protein
MRRREFIAGLGGAAWPVVARAQLIGKVRRVGFLSGASRTAVADVIAGFPQGMRELGYVEKRDFIMEWRFADGRYERFPELAAELVRLNVDVIVLGTPAAVRAAQQATNSIPIIMGYSTDPVGNGFIASLAHPGGNTTGLASSLDEIISKQLELMVTAVPNLTRIGHLSNPENPNHIPVLTTVQASAQRAGLTLVPFEARNGQEIENAFALFTRERAGAVVVVPDAFFNTQRQQIAKLALSERLPTTFSQREYVAAGGLMGYGEKLFDFFRRAATFVDKIFKGAKPADLPVEQPTRFYLTINLTTAKALGLTIPETLLATADEVIQ